MQAHTYLSADSVDDDNKAAVYPEEMLNTMVPNGLPAHNLTLKLGAPIMLLRNLNSHLGLANRTRWVCIAFHQYVIDAEIITGSHAGECVFIPRVELSPSDDDLPFHLRHRQFPVRPAFAMTINKAQGQTMQQVGLYLPEHVFSHGQLYVALSRVGSPDHIKVMVVDGTHEGHEGVYTRNVVYREVLQDQ